MSDGLDARFDELQQRLVPLWTSIQTFTQDPQTIVVVPSISLDSTIRGARQQAYEERYLFLLLLLRQPRARMVYVTSQAIHAEVIEYYLDLLPGVLASLAYGGNGITFGVVAADILLARCRGDHHPDAELFGFDRPSLGG